MDNLADGIRSTAAALGIDAHDLATIISYETGGTLSPTKKGPITRFGQHRGFIQFGEPQAEQHGADFSSTEAAMASQLGPNGAIVSYFKANGVKPGMNLLDLYSIVNTGSPGNYNHKDEASGGMSGTVYDKVNEQMAGHKAKAEELLGTRPTEMSKAIEAALRGVVAEEPNANISEAMNNNTQAAASSAPDGASEHKVTDSVQTAVNEVQQREMSRHVKTFITGMSPQFRMGEQAGYNQSVLQGYAGTFDDWFTQYRFPMYLDSYLKGDQQFIAQLSQPQQVMLQQVTSDMPVAQSFSHAIMGI